MKRVLLIATLIATTCMALPRPTQALANLPPIIPECDQTRYILQQVAVDPNFIGPTQGDGKVKVPPEEYGEGKKYDPDLWNLVEYTVNSNCTLNNFLELFVNLFNWMLYIVSILALLFMFIGGGTLLMSGGSEERVRSGKSILTNTVIGLAIALGSWLIVNTVYIAVLPEGSTRNGIGYLLDNQPWFRTSASKTYGSCSEPPEYPCKGGAGAQVVREVQTLLYDNGCFINADTREKEIDGSFGPKTLAAWNLWQRWNLVSPTTALGGYEGFKNSCTLLTSPPITP